MPKFMTLVRGTENHAPPPPALFEAIDNLMKEAGNRLVGVGGLLQSDKGARARLTKGTVTVTDGPFTEAKEVIGGFAIYDVASLGRSEGVDPPLPGRTRQAFPWLGLRGRDPGDDGLAAR